MPARPCKTPERLKPSRSIPKSASSSRRPTSARVSHTRSVTPKKTGQTPSKSAGLPDGWKVTPLIDERTGDTCLGIDFPHRLGRAGFEIIDDDLAEEPGKVRQRLKKRGAVFSGTKKDQIRFVAALLRAAGRETGILAMKPGWRKDG